MALSSSRAWALYLRYWRLYAWFEASIGFALILACTLPLLFFSAHLRCQDIGAYWNLPARTHWGRCYLYHDNRWQHYSLSSYPTPKA